MMTASEANLKAHLVNTDKYDSQLAKILSSIENEASNGNYETWYYEIIKTDVLTELARLGYSIGKQQSERNETMILIKWS